MVFCQICIGKGISKTHCCHLDETQCQKLQTPELPEYQDNLFKFSPSNRMLTK